MDEAATAVTPRPTRGIAPTRAHPCPYGPYLLLERIDQGGMAEVFRAVRRGPEGFMRTFALKRIAPQLASSPDFVAMFCAEARISALLNHPNVVQVYDFGEASGSYYLAMEHLKGRTVRAVLKGLAARRDSFPVAIAAHIARQVALGLTYAHGLRGPDKAPLNLVHRDITPSNVMLLRAGGVKILDFGIAKASAVSQLKTQAGLVKGKLAYASPEQLACKPLDGRSDIFSLGITFWEMLTQRRLFSASADFETVRKVLHDPIPPPSSLRGEVPAELDRIVLAALERERERRPDAKQLASWLRDFLRSSDDLEESLAELLNDLFGEPATSAFTLPSDVGVGAASSADAATRVMGGTALNALLEQPSAAPGAMVTTGAATGSAPVSPPASVATQGQGPTPRTPWSRSALAVTAVAVGIVAAAAVLALNASAFRQLLPFLRDPALASSPGEAPEVGTIVLELQTNPPGARIEVAGGKTLGRTPAIVRLTRGSRPVTVTLTKPGYEPLRYQLTPERDALATLDLRPAAARPAREPAGHFSHSPRSP